MKHLILILSLSILFEPIAYASIELRPSIHDQMTYQTKIDKKNIFQEKRAQKRQNVNKKTTVPLTKIPAQTLSSAPTRELKPSSQSAPSSPTSMRTINPLPGIDMESVRNSWFSWYNTYRSSLGLGSYLHDTRLDKTAHDWNTIFSSSRGQNHHTRNTGDGYYNYSMIDKWFIARGINPKPVNGSKHTENVGYGYYSCSQSDCTDQLRASIRSTFDFFMSEKGKSYDAHYRSIINPSFTKMGFDIIVIPSEKRYYITVHYITE